MALRQLEKIVANIVLLPATEANIGLSLAELAPIFKDPALQAQVIQVPGQPTQQMQLMSLREQVMVLVGGGRLTFEDKSAAIALTGRLSEIVAGFAALLATKGLAEYRAYGYNFEVAFDAPGEHPAAYLLLDRFVRNDELAKRLNIEPDGAGLRLYYPSGEARCDLRIEPREGKPNSPRFFASINYHYELPEGKLPAPDILQSDFHGKWGMFTDQLERLLGQQ